MKELLTILALQLTFLTTGQTEDLKPITILCVGDSTVETFAEKHALRGWGQMIGQYFKPEVRIENAARSGESSRSFIEGGLWKKALKAQPQYVLIQFGHNDNTEGDRKTEPDTTYKDYLRQYVRDARAIGAKPILVGSMTPRSFDDHGVLKPVIDIKKYRDAMRDFAREEDLPFIDLHAPSFAYYERLGAEESKRRHAPSEKDISHFNAEGADLMARLVVDGIARQMPELVPYLKQPEAQLATEIPE